MNTLIYTRKNWKMDLQMFKCLCVDVLLEKLLVSILKICFFYRSSIVNINGTASTANYFNTYYRTLTPTVYFSMRKFYSTVSYLPKHFKLHHKHERLINNEDVIGKRLLISWNCHRNMNTL